MDHASVETICAGNGLLERALGALRSYREAHARRRRKERAIDQLHALSDHALADIGLSRSDIESVIRFGARDASRHHR